MSRQSTEVLRFFFGLGQEEIARGLAEAPGSLDRLGALISAPPPEGWAGQTSADEALRYHYEFLYARAVQALTWWSEDCHLFLAVSPAERLGDVGGEAAADQGRLGQLTQLMETIERREGLSEDEVWLIEEGPADYEALREESEERFKHVRDTITLQALRRYDFQEYADLFLRDRMLFTVRLEVGRRLIAPRAGEPTPGAVFSFEDLLSRDYGEKALHLFRRRLEEQRKTHQAGR